MRSISRKITGIVIILSLLSLTINYLSPINADQLTVSGGGSGISGTGTNGQVTLWGAGNTLTGDTGLTYSGTGATFLLSLPLGAESAPSLAFGAGNGNRLYAGASAQGLFLSYANVGQVGFTGVGAGGVTLGSTKVIGWSTVASPDTNNWDLFLSRSAAATLQLGAANAASPVSQTIKAQGSRSGTDSNVAGGSFTISSSDGTGNAAGTRYQTLRNLMGASGTAAQLKSPSSTECESKTLSNTSATATAIVNVGLANNTSGALRATISVQCNDGTNFDSDLITTYVAYVNKAGTLTIGTPVTTASAAANNSGSCTVAPTIVANGTTSIDLKVTPVITTIVPTTTTAYVNVETFGNNAGAVTCQ